MGITAFKAALFKEAIASGFSDCEIYFRTGRNFESHIYKGEVSEYKNAGFSGLSFRGVYKGKMGYAYSERIDLDVIENLVKSALGNAEIIGEAEEETLYQGGGNYPEVNTYFVPLNDVSIADKIEAAKEMERAAYAQDPRVKSVTYCAIGDGEDEIFIANSYGLELSHRRNFGLAYVYTTVVENDSTKMAGEIWYGNNWADFSPGELAKKAVEKSISYLHASAVPGGKYKVLLNNEMARDLLTTFSGVFFAENAQKGFSLLKDRLGETVGSAVLTLRDDGVCGKSMGSLPFDSEGVATRNKAVIEKGVLKTLLYNRKSAAKDGVDSTGNGFKSGIQGAITTACTNFHTEPGQKTEAELLTEMGDGLLITELEGLHSGTNTISGDFSLSASGFLVEGGKIIRPVEQITVAGNFYQLLKDIVAVGSDLRFDMPSRTGTIGAACCLVRELDVSGV